jgi:hypothetical protein
VFATHAAPPGRPVQSASAPHSRQVLVPLVTQMGVGSAHCVLSRQPSQLLLMQAGSPGVVQSVSAPHCSQLSPTHIGPLVLPTQCVLFWHSTQIIVVRLQASLLLGAVAQSASDAQRSWQVLLNVPMMQRLGGVQWVSFKQERQEPAATSQKRRGGFCILPAQCSSVRQAWQRGPSGPLGLQ